MHLAGGPFVNFRNLYRWQHCTRYDTWDWVCTRAAMGRIFPESHMLLPPTRDDLLIPGAPFGILTCVSLLALRKCSCRGVRRHRRGCFRAAPAVCDATFVSSPRVELHIGIA